MVKKIQEDYTLGLLAHLLGLFTSFIGPLIIYLTMKNKKGKNYENTKHALNFQISLIIYAFICIILIFLLIGIPLIIALSIFELVVCILATVKASQGEVYEYPLEIKFVK